MLKVLIVVISIYAGVMTYCVFEHQLTACDNIVHYEDGTMVCEVNISRRFK